MRTTLVVVEPESMPRKHGSPATSLTGTRSMRLSWRTRSQRSRSVGPANRGASLPDSTFRTLLGALNSPANSDRRNWRSVPPCVKAAPVAGNSCVRGASTICSGLKPSSVMKAPRNAGMKVSGPPVNNMSGSGSMPRARVVSVCRTTARRIEAAMSSRERRDSAGFAHLSCQIRRSAMPSGRLESSARPAR